MKKLVYFFVMIGLLFGLVGCNGHPTFDQIRMTLQYSTQILKSPDGKLYWGVTQVGSNYVWAIVRNINELTAEYVSHGVFFNYQDALSRMTSLQKLGWTIIFITEISPEVVTSVILQIFFRVPFIIWFPTYRLPVRQPPIIT